MSRSFLRKLFQFVWPKKSTLEQRRQKLMQQEMAIGSQLFGPIPQNRERQFYYLNNQTWVWNETVADGSGRKVTTTTQYQVLPDQIVKSQGGQTLSLTDAAEINNLFEAASWYYDLVAKRVYGKVT
ncbi:hypothetical protein HY441_00360 [Candidatus Microgenomates bacterium]|nr:hypothetical protein [Candidatus Microgenomates bacterium]